MLKDETNETKISTNSAYQGITRKSQSNNKIKP